MDRKAEQGAPAARTTLIIDRSRWLRGEGGGASFLIREGDGKMCCLGFYGLDCGVPETLLRGFGRPDEEAACGGGWPEWLVRRFDEFEDDVEAECSRDGCALMGLNDDDKIVDADREEKIAAIFAEHGVDVRFVDGASNG